MSIPKNSHLVVNICRVFFARTDQVTFKAGTDRYHKKVSFPAGKYWNELYFTPGSADFAENDKVIDQGPILEQSLKLILPGEDESNIASQEDLAHPLIILMKTADGSYRLFGRPENPVKLTNNKQMGSKSRSEMTFSCLSQERAWWHDLPVTLAS